MPAHDLLGLPLVLFRMIVEILHDDDAKSLYTLRCVSRVCRDESDVLLFRSIRLKDHLDLVELESGMTLDLYMDEAIVVQEELWLQKVTKNLLQCILDKNRSIARHVRHLEIGAFHQGFFDEALAPVLEDVLTMTTGLQSLSWGTSIPIPEGALHLLHTMHPSARMHVTNLEREGKPLDRRLLSSPQLHSLQLCVYYDEPDQNLHSEGCRSELQILKGYLTLGNSIKKLDLTFEKVMHTIFGKALGGLKDCAQGPLNFHWQEGDRFPTLEEWVVSESYADYAYTAQHMDMWHRCMDWSLLRVLDLGHSNTYPSLMLPIMSLTGHVPRLDALTLAVSNDNEHDKEDPKRSLSILEEFLRNVLALKKLRLVWHGIPDCLPMILQHQGSTLRELSLEELGDTAPWSHQLFLDILSKAPQLCCLDVETSNQHSEFELEGRWSGKAVNSSPSEKYKSMEHMVMTFQLSKAKAEAAILKRLDIPYVLRRDGRYELDATGVTWIPESP